MTNHPCFVCGADDDRMTDRFVFGVMATVVFEPICVEGGSDEDDAMLDLDRVAECWKEDNR